MNDKKSKFSFDYDHILLHCVYLLLIQMEFTANFKTNPYLFYK